MCTVEKETTTTKKLIIKTFKLYINFFQQLFLILKKNSIIFVACKEHITCLKVKTTLNIMKNGRATP